MVPASGIASGCRDNLRREQTKKNAVLVRRPDCSIGAEKTSPRALLAAKADRSIEQSRREPLEADGNLEEIPAKPLDDTIYQRATDQGFADSGVLTPV